MSTKTKPRSPPKVDLRPVKGEVRRKLAIPLPEERQVPGLPYLSKPIPATIIGVLAVVQPQWDKTEVLDLHYVPRGTYWRILHRPTGLSVACCRTKKDAISLATDLQELADWSQVEENGKPRLELSKIVCPYLRGDPRSC